MSRYKYDIIGTMNTVRDEQAARLLLAGGVGIIPTDTVYGLVARADNREAVARLYALKNRERKPGPVIAANLEQLRALGIAEEHLKVVAHLWPNPISIIMPLPPSLDYIEHELGGAPVRIPADEMLHRLLEQTGPLLTSSANQPAEPVATTIAKAYAYFGDAVDFYVDGGDLSHRAPSTIIRLYDNNTLKIFRQGSLHVTLNEQGKAIVAAQQH